MKRTLYELVAVAVALAIMMVSPAYAERTITAADAANGVTITDTGTGGSGGEIGGDGVTGTTGTKTVGTTEAKDGTSTKQTGTSNTQTVAGQMLHHTFSFVVRPIIKFVDKIVEVIKEVIVYVDRPYEVVKEVIKYVDREVIIYRDKECPPPVTCEIPKPCKACKGQNGEVISGIANLIAEDDNYNLSILFLGLDGTRIVVVGEPVNIMVGASGARVNAPSGAKTWVASCDSIVVPEIPVEQPRFQQYIVVPLSVDDNASLKDKTMITFKGENGEVLTSYVTGQVEIGKQIAIGCRPIDKPFSWVAEIGLDQFGWMAPLDSFDQLDHNFDLADQATSGKGRLQTIYARQMQIINRLVGEGWVSAGGFWLEDWPQSTAPDPWFTPDIPVEKRDRQLRNGYYDVDDATVWVFRRISDSCTQ